MEGGGIASGAKYTSSTCITILVTILTISAQLYSVRHQEEHQLRPGPQSLVGCLLKLGLGYVGRGTMQVTITYLANKPFAIELL